MAVTNKWSVTQMNCYPEKDGDRDVVFMVSWTLLATEVVNGVTYTGYVYGAEGLTISSEEPFTPYESLTEEQVLGWVWGAMGAEQKVSYEANVTQQIYDQKNPPVVTPPLPWADPQQPVIMSKPAA